MATVSTWCNALESAGAASMQIYAIDPLVDSRWDDLVQTHPKASVFHRRGWLHALANTYGYRPIVLTSTPAGKRLADGIVFCEVKSWITGTRLVSLPFADHCEPLVEEGGELLEFLTWMRVERDRHDWKYVEMRPLSWETNAAPSLMASQSYWFHTLDLTPSLGQIFSGLHKNSMQRRIQRAEREQLSYETGCSEPLLDDFYRLLLITRKRHQLLPQPRAWFRNLVAGMGPDVEIRLASKGDIPIAAILTLRHQKTVVYKYGCSDGRFHHLAAMPFLFWKLIEESKAAGAERIDLGRTDLDNEGLTTFKDRFGASRKSLTYFRYSKNAMNKSYIFTHLATAKSLISLLPDALLPWAGYVVYRHIG